MMLLVFGYMTTDLPCAESARWLYFSAERVNGARWGLGLFALPPATLVGLVIRYLRPRTSLKRAAVEAFLGASYVLFLNVDGGEMLSEAGFYVFWLEIWTGSVVTAAVVFALAACMGFAIVGVKSAPRREVGGTTEDGMHWMSRRSAAGVVLLPSLFGLLLALGMAAGSEGPREYYTETGDSLRWLYVYSCSSFTGYASIDYGKRRLSPNVLARLMQRGFVWTSQSMFIHAATGYYRRWIWPPGHVYFGADDPNSGLFLYVTMQGRERGVPSGMAEQLVRDSRAGLAMLRGRNRTMLPKDPAAGIAQYAVVCAIMRNDSELLRRCAGTVLDRGDVAVNEWLGRLLRTATSVKGHPHPSADPKAVRAFERQWKEYLSFPLAMHPKVLLRS